MRSGEIIRNKRSLSIAVFEKDNGDGSYTVRKCSDQRLARWKSANIESYPDDQMYDVTYETCGIQRSYAGDKASIVAFLRAMPAGQVRESVRIYLVGSFNCVCSFPNEFNTDFFTGYEMINIFYAKPLDVPAESPAETTGGDEMPYLMLPIMEDEPHETPAPPTIMPKKPVYCKQTGDVFIPSGDHYKWRAEIIYSLPNLFLECTLKMYSDIYVCYPDGTTAGKLEVWADPKSDLDVKEFFRHPNIKKNISSWTEKPLAAKGVRV